MDWKGKKVLVTGISGFIGSNLARRLVDLGAIVSGIVVSSNLDNQDILSKCNIYIGDICDYNLVRQVISSNEIEMVFHLAAYSIVRISALDPMSAYDVNVKGTVTLLEACRSVGICKKIIVASSDKAYGDHDELPYIETFPLQPKNIYDVSKACMDMIAQSYAYNYDMPITVVRCSNVFGPYDYNRSRLIPNNIVRLLNGEQPLMYGSGNMQREFIYIDDVVDAYIAIVERGISSVYNIGNNTALSIRYVIETISYNVLGKQLEPVIVPRTNFKEIERQCIDPARLMVDTGWKPKYNLWDGLCKTVEWYRGNQ